MSADVVVVGGGIAGIAAALRLAQGGARVELLETRRKLGGRATSFTDPRTKQVLDNCQHVALGCCTNYLALCDELGVTDAIAWHDAIYWIEPGGRTSVMRPAPLPVPGHYGPSLLAAKFLTPGERLAVARAMLAALTTERARHAGGPFSDWLARAGQSPRAIERFWEPIVVSACNVTCAACDASVALHVLQEGFLAHRHSARMGLSAVPLLRLYDPAEEVIRSAGGSVRLGASVVRVGAREAVLADGERVGADRVVCALPFERALRVLALDEPAMASRLSGVERLGHSPIIGVHLLFDRPVLGTANAVLVGRGTQWLFRKDEGGRAVHAVISAADAWVGLDEDEIVQRVLDDVRACIPSASGAEPVSVRAVKEKRATFAPTPASVRCRPGAVDRADPLTGPVLAGDWTDTGWPATMEGAARSGFIAAAYALGEDPASALKPALAPSLLVRLLGAAGLRDQHRQPRSSPATERAATPRTSDSVEAA